MLEFQQHTSETFFKKKMQSENKENHVDISVVPVTSSLLALESPRKTYIGVENVLKEIWKDENAEVFKLDRKQESGCFTSTQWLELRPVPMSEIGIPIPTKTKIIVVPKSVKKRKETVLIFDKDNKPLFNFCYDQKPKNIEGDVSIVSIFVPGIPSPVGTISYTEDNLEAGLLTDFVTNTFFKLTEFKIDDGFHLKITNPSYLKNPLVVAQGFSDKPIYDNFYLKFCSPPKDTIWDTSITSKSLILVAYVFWALLYYQRLERGRRTRSWRRILSIC